MWSESGEVINHAEDSLQLCLALRGLHLPDGFDLKWVWFQSIGCESMSEIAHLRHTDAAFVWVQSYPFFSGPAEHGSEVVVVLLSCLPKHNNVVHDAGHALKTLVCPIYSS